MLIKALKNRYIKDNVAMMAGTLIGGILGYLYHFIVSRQLPISQYGELQSLISIFLIFGVFNSALSYFTVSHTSVFAAHGDKAANWEFIDYLIPKVLKYAAIFFVIILVASLFFSSALHFSSSVGFVFISLATFISTIAVVYMEVLRGWKEFILLSVAGVLVVFSKLLSGVALAYISHKTSVVSLSILIPSFAGWYLSRRWSRKKIVKEGSAENQKKWKDKYFSETNIRKTAVNILFFSLAIVLVSNLDVVLVKYFSDAKTTGYYGAFGILGKIILWLNLAVVSVMLPGACSEGHLGRRPNKKQLLNSYGIMILVGISAMLFYYIAPDLTIRMFFGEKYVYDTSVLWLFGLMSFLLSLLTLEANLSFAKRDFRVVYFLIATVILMVSGVSKYHANLKEIVLAFTASFLFGYIFITLLNLSHERRKIIPQMT